MCHTPFSETVRVGFDNTHQIPLTLESRCRWDVTDYHPMTATIPTHPSGFLRGPSSTFCPLSYPFLSGHQERSFQVESRSRHSLLRTIGALTVAGRFRCCLSNVARQPQFPLHPCSSAPSTSSVLAASLDHLHPPTWSRHLCSFFGDSSSSRWTPRLFSENMQGFCQTLLSLTGLSKAEFLLSYPHSYFMFIL